ncbi:unnamed protein product [Tilletia controversa]|uniref:Peptidase S54 rhomboid domain-containing protein n=3 Tax=Tilletia TaxID=13289 RepID=A0A8X7MV45_9BASI|nr:hypothetical protein CF336_g2564 [Tilletia laevis]KAE8202144.1 hypothetical protein CF328_g2381 [Tilletia controversa]KAE8262973.1 hypothetical protein A4X03_0g2030 [Tilletia caries]KAE8206608.1 hypothetical protein CF335_g1752 [Tilletia laevis]KAE8249761.1 hypothetical protein A4X06_0g3082 [Tilletia controversa]
MLTRVFPRCSRPYVQPQEVRLDIRQLSGLGPSLVAARRLTLSTKTARGLPDRNGPIGKRQYRVPPQFQYPPPPHGGRPYEEEGEGRPRLRLNALWVVIGANTLVFAYYQHANNELEKRRDPTAVLWLRENFMTHGMNVMQRPWSLILSTFTHSNASHFIFNMLALHAFGSIINTRLGPRVFLATYLGAGLTASVAHVALERYRSIQRNRQKPNPRLLQQLGSIPSKPTRNQQEHGAIGASGSILGLGSLVACIWPRLPMLLYGVVPVPMWGLVCGYVAYDFFSVASDRQDFISHSAHLGGALYGAAFYLFSIKPRRGRII